jgi:hypothetical protein
MGATMLTDTMSTLPQVVADHLAACNNHDAKAMMATFAADAFVNDAGRAFLDRAAIQAWVETEIVVPKVTMDVTDTIVRKHAVILRAKIDGEYDKTGLPDPLVLTYHFGVADGEIAQLIITLNKPDQ